MKKNQQILNLILADISAANAAQAAPIAQDESNEVIASLLAKHGLADDEAILEEFFGRDGSDAIRDAENGS